MKLRIRQKVGLVLTATGAIAALLAQPRTRFVLAEREGHLVGFVQLAFGAKQALVAAEPAVEVQRLYVQARFNGQGVGKALVGAAAARAAAAGAQALWLTAWVGNAHALAWYRRRRTLSRSSIGYVMIAAGAVGNLVDRVARGYVVDFVHLAHWPVFNVADVLIAVGGILLATSLVPKKRAAP